jgi:hypothetical protein
MQNLSFKNPSKVLKNPSKKKKEFSCSQANEHVLSQTTNTLKIPKIIQEQDSEDFYERPIEYQKSHQINRLKNKSVLIGVRTPNQRQFMSRRGTITTNNSRKRNKYRNSIQRKKLEKSKINFKEKTEKNLKEDQKKFLIKSLRYQNKHIDVHAFKKIFIKMNKEHRNLEMINFNNNVIKGNLMKVIKETIPKKRKSILTVNLKNNSMLEMSDRDLNQLFEYCQSKNINLIL